MTAAAARRLALVAGGTGHVRRRPGRAGPGAAAAGVPGRGLAGRRPGVRAAPGAPAAGLRKCAVIDCEAGVRTPGTDLCKLCVEKFKASGLAMASSPRSRRTRSARASSVPRPWMPATVAPAGPALLRPLHPVARAGLSREEFAASPAARPLASFGECLVAPAAGPRRYARLCAPHRSRWLAAGGKAGAGLPTSGGG